MLRNLVGLSFAFLILVSMFFILGGYSLLADLTNLANGFENDSTDNKNSLVKQQIVKNNLISPHELASGDYETIEDTMSRLKRDVYVTGTLIGVPGQEQAFFKIEGMPDRSFNINTQLMDGFIITEITNNHVVLKNQIGDETFFLFVGEHDRDAEAESLLSHSEDSYQIELLPENKTGSGIRIMNDEHLVDEATASGQQVLYH